MSPRSPSVNEAMRQRSRERLLQATVELVEERGYEATTLADITKRAGSARGLVSYYYSGKRALLQSAVHRLMNQELAAAMEREPRTEDGEELLARAIDAILGLTQTHTTLMRTHMASILQEEGFIQCPEQQRLALLLRQAVACWGAADPDEEYRLLRALLMGATVALLLPGAPMPLAKLRAELFQRYELDWSAGLPPSGGELRGGEPGPRPRRPCRAEESVPAPAPAAAARPGSARIG
ncbi:TetR/AcrR family transcriptional regulator [Actinacidiphila sp. ITFR-21]|uniref:TetR/AcrR family transcriptional regulator n=1 Tax=Actinacidiphila sp. ITFR-21 TaxID=3075199 RepID=UPI00288A4D09|nr:TetR/AcrR family transcriptional regulator [Streptomyces sp. ITFR-21]WNI19114.1 TetR/AcrR family transcriptional regulator [Streptomyces sp. ITFR-21]